MPELPSSPNHSATGVEPEALRHVSRDELLRQFRAGVDVHDRMHHWRLVRSCFVGAEAASWFVEADFAGNAAEAVALGNMLMREGAIEGVTTKARGFKDDKTLYRLVDAGLDLQRAGLNVEDVGLEVVVDRLRAGVEIRDRIHGLKKYSLCFVGSEAVAWMIRAGFASCVDGAVALGNRMIREGLIRHVHHGQKFKNKYALYKFAKDHRGTKRRSLDAMWRSFDSLAPCGAMEDAGTFRASVEVVFEAVNLTHQVTVLENTRQNRSQTSVSGHLMRMAKSQTESNSSCQDWREDGRSSRSEPNGTHRRVTFSDDYEPLSFSLNRKTEKSKSPTSDKLLAWRRSARGEGAALRQT